VSTPRGEWVRAERAHAGHAVQWRPAFGPVLLVHLCAALLDEEARHVQLRVSHGA
jgi:hypothetical protein